VKLLYEVMMKRWAAGENKYLSIIRFPQNYSLGIAAYFSLTSQQGKT
jgi:hypothetical protein